MEFNIGEILGLEVVEVYTKEWMVFHVSSFSMTFVAPRPTRYVNEPVWLAHKDQLVGSSALRPAPCFDYGTAVRGCGFTQPLTHVTTKTNPGSLAGPLLKGQQSARVVPLYTFSINSTWHYSFLPLLSQGLVGENPLRL